MNIGWPVVDDGSRVVLPAVATTARDDPVSPIGLGSWSSVPAPQVDWAEQMFFHKLVANDDGLVRAVVTRTAPPFVGVEIRFALNDFPYFAQWKVMGEGEYVIALEPANCLVEGFEAEKAKGRLTILRPGEKRRYRLEVSILVGDKQINDSCRAVEVAIQQASRPAK
jgi:hypothetical protein